MLPALLTAEDGSGQGLFQREIAVSAPAPMWTSGMHQARGCIAGVNLVGRALPVLGSRGRNRRSTTRVMGDELTLCSLEYVDVLVMCPNLLQGCLRVAYLTFLTFGAHILVRHSPFGSKGLSGTGVLSRYATTI